MAKTPLLNLVISDTHCGSDVGLLPPLVELEDGQHIGHGKNKKQKWLWESWSDMQERALQVIGKEPFVLTFNGDLIEGIHHRSEEVVAAKIMEHITIAKEAMGGLVKRAAKVYIVRGTECHVRDLETVFAQAFDLDKAKDIQQYKIHGCLVDARHHMSTTSRLHLEATALSVEMANLRSNLTRVGHPLPRVFIRGHRHVMGDYSDGESMILVPGAWQCLTRHGHKVVPGSMPRPSAYLLDWRGSPVGGLPATHRFVYNPPYDTYHG
jgi:hypothetical protein